MKQYLEDQLIRNHLDILVLHLALCENPLGAICLLCDITAKCHLDPIIPISAKSNNATFIEKSKLRL